MFKVKCVDCLPIQAPCLTCLNLVALLLLKLASELLAWLNTNQTYFTNKSSKNFSLIKVKQLKTAEKASIYHCDPLKSRNARALTKHS